MNPISDLTSLPLSTFFQSPESWEGKEISVRGFLYQKEGQTVLALEPNIPSCCIGKKPTLNLQGDFPLTSGAILVQGTIVKDPFGWKMDSAKAVKEPTYFVEFFLIIIFAIFWWPLKAYFKNRFG